jgi:hypothetical protein
MKFLYFIDEVAPYLPPHPYNPPAKSIIKLLFKQGRKYGVSCVLATQNLKDVDYKILDQTHTKIIGKVKDPRETKNIKELINNKAADTYAEKLSTFEAGEFLVLNSKIKPLPIQIKFRWLYTDHGLPLNDDDVQELTTDEMRAWAKKMSLEPELIQRDEVTRSTKVEKTNSNEEKNTSKASNSNLDDAGTVEINLLGGLSVLQTTKDPLHLMLALTNIVTALSFLVVEFALFDHWNKGSISIIYPMLGLGLTILCGGIFLAESFMRDHVNIIQSIRERSRSMHLLVLAWAWVLFLLPNFSNIEYSSLSEACVIVAQTLTTVFFFVDITHRFQLKKIEFEFGTSIFDAAKNSAKLLIGASQFMEIKASSEMLLRNIRMVSDALAIYILLVLLEVLPPLSTETQYDLVIRIFSLMVLNFITELLLRIRNNN